MSFDSNKRGENWDKACALNDQEIARLRNGLLCEHKNNIKFMERTIERYGELGRLYDSRCYKAEMAEDSDECELYRWLANLAELEMLGILQFHKYVMDFDRSGSEAEPDA